MEKKTFYITTPIYFPSNKLHIGHSYTTVAADTMARYKKLRGYDVCFLTGTDEHGQKIERNAEAAGVTPKQYVDDIVAWIKDLWKTMDIKYDYYLRTTDKHHEKAVQIIFKRLYDQGDIYKSEYEGWYCTPCESFFTERQLEKGKCPDCNREVEKVKEESYFFKLSKYQDRLIEYIESHPDFIQPQSRKNEMINNFLKPGLEDLCVSRTTFKWGIPVDFDPKHIVYVWIDALTNYITALGYTSEDDSQYKKYWPADIHLVGKEITRFHTIIWPIMLMALNEPLPKQVFGHGWLVIDGKKMGKSVGNVVDPFVLIERYGVDAVRYFLMREIVFGQDGNFSNEALIQRINSDLANDLGNLLSRTVAMIEKYFGGEGLPLNQIGNEFDSDVKTIIVDVISKMAEAMDKLFFSDALSEIWKIIRRVNKYIDETTPWIAAKDESKKAELAGTMYTIVESLRIVSVLISSFMPSTSKIIFEQLNIKDESLKTWDSLPICSDDFGKLPRNIVVTKGAVIFPRIDLAKEMEEIASNPAFTGKIEETTPVIKSKKDSKIKNMENSEIGIEDFAKIELKVGEVLECNLVEDSDKLLCSKIRIGNKTRQIVSGIAKYYSPDEMISKKVIVVCNLKPVKLRGVLSEGMILCAEDEKGVLKLVTVEEGLESGATVS